jgi:hypothetical protein
MGETMSADRVVEVVHNGAHHGWVIHCPGCDDVHCLDTRWTFNGDRVKPTFRASLLVHPVNLPDGTPVYPRCHSYVTDGKIEFLSDCTHALAGQTVELPAFREKHPHWNDAP